MVALPAAAVVLGVVVFVVGDHPARLVVTCAASMLHAGGFRGRRATRSARYCSRTARPWPCSPGHCRCRCSSCPGCSARSVWDRRGAGHRHSHAHPLRHRAGATGLQMVHHQHPCRPSRRLLDPRRLPARIRPVLSGIALRLSQVSRRPGPDAWRRKGTPVRLMRESGPFAGRTSRCARLRKPVQIVGSLLVPVSYTLVVFLGAKATSLEPVAVVSLDRGPVGTQLVRAMTRRGRVPAHAHQPGARTAAVQVAGGRGRHHDPGRGVPAGHRP